MDVTTHQSPEIAHEQGEIHEHPTWSTYWKVAVVLTIITALEVWVYYTPLQHSRLFVPILVAMSALKFAIVVLFYMHLRYDHRLFRALFTGPLILAMTVVVVLLFLFGHAHFGQGPV
jgi:cytochrome c oxidase subunit 4